MRGSTGGWAGDWGCGCACGGCGASGWACCAGAGAPGGSRSRSGGWAGPAARVQEGSRNYLAGPVRWGRAGPAAPVPAGSRSRPAGSGVPGWAGPAARAGAGSRSRRLAGSARRGWAGPVVRVQGEAVTALLVGRVGGGLGLRCRCWWGWEAVAALLVRRGGRGCGGREAVAGGARHGCGRRALRGRRRWCVPGRRCRLRWVRLERGLLLGRQRRLGRGRDGLLRRGRLGRGGVHRQLLSLGVGLRGPLVGRGRGGGLVGGRQRRDTALRGRRGSPGGRGFLYVSRYVTGGARGRVGGLGGGGVGRGRRGRGRRRGVDAARLVLRGAGHVTGRVIRRGVGRVGGGIRVGGCRRGRSVVGALGVGVGVGGVRGFRGVPGVRVGDRAVLVLSARLCGVGALGVTVLRSLALELRLS